MTEDVSLHELIRILADERRLDLRGYKHNTLERRIRKRMFDVNARDYSEYLRRIRENRDEINELLNTVLINVTEFFRDPQAWECLDKEVLRPRLAKLERGESFRAWSAGCASGEEPFSLAILLADFFGPRLPHMDIKVYATDVDEDALNVARHGEYPAEHMRRVRPEWRRKYFQGTTTVRINRDLRRMVIFGRSNLVADAPISHCDLVLCRNVLIYFDPVAQGHILDRLHYALEPNGVLFLGKAESKLNNSHVFRALNLRWRIFQKVDTQMLEVRREQGFPEMAADPGGSRMGEELNRLKLYQRSLLDTLKSGVVVLNSDDEVLISNDAALRRLGLGALAAGKPIARSDLALRCPELVRQVGASHSTNNPIEFQCRMKAGGEERLLNVVVRPVLTDAADTRMGSVVYAEDITDRERLQGTVEQLAATSKELQSANEELETTNEELQSTNEELETTNEELQSTNEELETTNEELQSLNEELENMNEELETRTRELNVLSKRYAETLRCMPWPVMIVDRWEKVQLWNAAAQGVFGIGETSVTGVDIDHLPMNAVLRSAIVRRCRGVLGNRDRETLPNQAFRTDKTEIRFDIYFTAISQQSGEIEGVLVVFSPRSDAEPEAARKKQSNNKNNSKKRKLEPEPKG